MEESFDYIYENEQLAEAMQNADSFDFAKADRIAETIKKKGTN